MKWLIPIIIFILCCSPVLADNELANKILNFKSTVSDGVCEGLENPLLNKDDCNWNEFWNSEWFIKLILLLAIIYILNNPAFLQDKNAGILIGVFIVILLFPMDNFINQNNDVNDINQSIVPENNQTLIQGKITNTTSYSTPILVIEKSLLEKTIDWILLLPNKLWPSHPRIALIILLIVGFLLYQELGRTGDKIRFRL